MAEKSTTTNTPKAGDMVAIQRFNYCHYGIADGEGNLIHSHSEPNESGKSKIIRQPLKDVAGKDKYVVKNQDNSHPPLPSGEVVKRAMAWVGKPWKYSLFDKNCETFASMMRYGDDKGTSTQAAETLEEFKAFNRRDVHDPFTAVGYFPDKGKK